MPTACGTLTGMESEIDTWSIHNALNDRGQGVRSLIDFLRRTGSLASYTETIYTLLNRRKTQMATSYPKRPNTHQLEELSKRYFISHLPSNWVCEKPENDYGVDLKVDIFEDQNATAMELLIQLKSSQTSDEHEYETINLKTSTYNYLWDKLQVVMLVKFVAGANKAYWLLLSDVDEPDQSQDSFTIRIPKNNDLETINWKEIEEYVRKIKDKKLSVRDRHVFQR